MLAQAGLGCALLLAVATGFADEPGQLQVGRLIYGDNQSSVCFAEAFLADAAESTSLRPAPTLTPVASDSDDLYAHPLIVMSGQEAFTLDEAERTNLRRYLDAGGFLLASAGCSSPAWNDSFSVALEGIFPGALDELITLPADHPAYHLVYDVSHSGYRRGGARLPELRALRRGGRIVLIWSPDGLNDSAAASDECCCCGGNEVGAARQLNVNLLVLALTQ